MWAECGTIFKKWASVGLAAHGFYMPLPISYGCIVGYYMPLLWAGCVAFHAPPTYSPTYGGAVSDTDPTHKGMNQIHTPTQKSVSIDTSDKGVNLTDCHRSA